MRLQPKSLFEVDSDYEILASMEVVREVTNGITIDYLKVPADSLGDKKILKGMPMSKITASGKYRPYTGGLTLVADIAIGAVTATLNDVSRLVVGDVLHFDNGTTNENVTILTINTTTKAITFAATTNAYTTVNAIITNADGGDAPTVILKRQVNVKDGDHVVAGFEIAKVISARIPVTVDATLISRMPGIIFA